MSDDLVCLSLQLRSIELMYKILIIEDDRAILKALETNLKAEGYQIESATDGPTGLERAQDPSQDLILLDLMLPRLSGEEICQTLRRSGVTTPILDFRLEFDSGRSLDRGR